MSYEFSATVEGTKEHVAHLAAHLTTGEELTDYCERSLIGDGAFGLDYQIERGLEYLRLVTGISSGVLAELEEWAKTDPGEVADEIETLSDNVLQWDDGDLFECPPCELQNSINEGSWALDIETQGEHVRIALTLGGPNIWLTRDWDGDNLGIYWGSDRYVRSNSDATEILDYVSESMEL